MTQWLIEEAASLALVAHENAEADGGEEQQLLDRHAEMMALRAQMKGA